MPFAPSTVLAKLIQENEADIRLRGAKTLDLLYTKGQVKTAKTTDLNWNVILSDSQTATVAMTTAGVNQTTGDTVQASLGIGTYKIYHQFSLNRVDLVDASQKGTAALKSLFDMHVKSGVLALRKQVNNYIWTGTGAVGFGGFVGFPVVLDNTLSYAGISPVTYTNWVSIKDTNATNRNLTKTLLSNLMTQMDTEEVYYDTIVTSPTTAQRYGDLWESIMGNNQNIYAADRRVADLYTGARYWQDTPILTDRFCPAGQIVFFESSNIELLSFDLSDADQGVLAGFGLKDNFNSIASVEVGGLRINVALLPQTNPGVLDFQLFVIPQMKVMNRRLVQAIDKLN